MPPRETNAVARFGPHPQFERCEFSFKGNEMLEHAAAELQVSELLRNVLSATRLDLNFTIQPHPGAVPDLTVEFTGPDTPCLTAQDAELLKALEHLAAKVRRLEPDQHDLLSFDAASYKRNRDHALRQSAHRAAARVAETKLPYTFPPMSSHERRQLHLILTAMNLKTSSTGEGRTRHVILYPPGTPT